MTAIGFVLGLTSIYFVVELVVGLWLGSLTLRADAFHMLSDMIALAIGLWAQKASKRPPSDQATYGYQRATVVGGLVNVAFLMGNAFSIFTEAVTHFFEETNEDLKDKKNATILMIVAGIGLVINCIGICMVSHDHDHGASNHSSRAVLLHLFGDFFGSMAALGSAIVLRYWTSWSNRALVDPILSLLVVGLICVSAVPVFRDTVHILLAKTPKGSEAEAIRKEISDLEAVASVHHLHLWEMGGVTRLASVHIHPLPSLGSPRALHDLRRLIQEILHRHSYHSSTIQFDHAFDEPCEMDCGASPCRKAQCCSPTRHHNPFPSSSSSIAVESLDSSKEEKEESKDEIC